MKWLSNVIASLSLRIILLNSESGGGAEGVLYFNTPSSILWLNKMILFYQMLKVYFHQNPKTAVLADLIYAKMLAM